MGNGRLTVLTESARRASLSVLLAASCLSLATACGAKRAETTASAGAVTGHSSVSVLGPGGFRVAGVGLETPESVLYDERHDVYLISNVVGVPNQADHRAFISRMTPDGTVTDLKWIESGAKGATLDAPKGMALSEDTLYVADITRVRKFDRETGKPDGSIEIPGSSFLNDVVIDGDHRLYVSDSGLGPDLSPNGNDAVYRISENGSVEKIAGGTTLGRPNGLAMRDDGLWLVTFGSGELYRLDAAGQRAAVTRPPAGSLDGLAALEGRLFISSWEASAIYALAADGSFVEVVRGVPAPADIGVDPKRRRLLIPLFNDDAVVVHELAR